ncbi:MAG: DUF4931 domain-containing protein [Patescibacteria group bacterium]
MAKFVPDIKSNRWVVIAPTRVSRPHDNPVMPAQSSCPFCPGNEGLNEEVFKLGSVRVIKNKYPITDFHEVIIHSPDHEKDIDELPAEQVELILKTYRERFNYYRDLGTARLQRYAQHCGQVMIFNNHDIHAGASLKHPHSQLVVVPRQINLDTMKKEPVQNEVARTKHFVAYCPDFSQWPYEIWLAPNSISNFGQITDEEISDLAPLMQKILGFICKKFAGEDDVPYNYYIYHGGDWYLRIIPRLVHRAGFELGTGLSVNIVDPVTAAGEFKLGLRNKRKSF